MTIFAEPMVHDELVSVVDALCAKMPERPRTEVEHVVSTVYTGLSANARLTAHLIPLTLNKSRQLLKNPLRDDDGERRYSGVST